MIRGLVFVVVFLSFSVFSDYFPKDYESARKAFREAATPLTDKIEGSEYGLLTVPDEADQSLSIDYAYFPAEKKEKIFILTSGVHGAEAYAGSALQQLFFKEIFQHVDREKVGLLIIHSVNPWGFQHNRRVNENNVDLNRNFGGPQLYKTDNEVYHDLNSFLNPQRKVSYWDIRRLFDPFRMLYLRWKYSYKQLMQGMLQGQYEYGRGIYYGGDELQVESRLVMELVSRLSGEYDMALLVDLHTGYGERGKMHLFGSPEKSQVKKDALKAIFADYKIDTGEDEDFYETHGDLTVFVSQVLKSFTLAMTFEFGTLDSQTFNGALLSLNNMRLENQLHFYGARRESDEEWIETRFSEMFNPSDAAWREQVILQGRTAFLKTVGNLAAFRIEP